MPIITLVFQIVMEYCDNFAEMSQIELDSILSGGLCDNLCGMETLN